MFNHCTVFWRGLRLPNFWQSVGLDGCKFCYLYAPRDLSSNRLMKISVAICTWNRCELLRQTLDSLCRLRVPESVAWEIIVVDNGSTDATRAVVDSFANRLPVRYVLESERGHSISRNTAIKNVTGELILWTDNDVIVDPDWLAAYCAAAERFPDASYFGGKIEPIFQSAKPHWLAETWAKVHPVYAARDLGDTEFPLPPEQFPFGANFAVRTSVQRNFLFNTQFGRSGTGMLGDDEVQCLQRINGASQFGVWVPAARVEHFIPDDRATPEYVRDYFIGQGTMNVVKERSTMKSNFHALRVAVFNLAIYKIKRRFAVADEWVSHLIRGSIAWGEYLGGLGMIAKAKLKRKNRTRNANEKQEQR